MTNQFPLILMQLKQLREIIVAISSEAEPLFDDSEHLFLERFDELVSLVSVQDNEAPYLGQEIISQVFIRFPQIGHLVPRELLWFFGGDCLHYMPDKEIACFQTLEELRYQAETQGTSFDWLLEKQKLLTKQRH